MEKETKLGALICAYNEANYIDYAISCAYQNVDYISIVEGAYDEMIKCGASSYSTDGTLDIIDDWIKKDKGKKIIYHSVNLKTDKDHRNIGFKSLKEKGCSWGIIVDADEIIPSALWILIKRFVSTSSNPPSIRVCYLKSQTFVNDLNHYVFQEFPRIFWLGKGCEFANDNYVNYLDMSWLFLAKTKIETVPYWHFAFMKPIERFEIKKRWWETRFPEKKFVYDWHVEEREGKKIIVPDNHTIYEGTPPKELCNILDKNK